MKNTATIITLFAFITYWITTFFFTFPDNPINVKELKFRQYFDSYFSQNWGFFAPPPNTNERLYFTYFYNDHKTLAKKTKIFEVLEPINLEKKINAPFNKKEDVFDYMISGSVHNIKNDIGEISNMNEITHKKTNTKQDKTKIIVENIEKTDSFKIISNYAKFIAKKNQIPFNNTQYNIIITQVAVPKFINRNSTNKKEEQIVFSSNIHAL